MSPSRLSGIEPRQYVEYVWDGDRLVGAEIIREPEWSSHDLDLVMAVDVWERSLNPTGMPIDEATSPEANPNNYSGGYYYMVGEPVIDWAERARAHAEEEYRKRFKDPDMSGLIFQPVKTLRPHVEQQDH